MIQVGFCRHRNTEPGCGVLKLIWQCWLCNSETSTLLPVQGLFCDTKTHGPFLGGRRLQTDGTALMEQKNSYRTASVRHTWCNIMGLNQGVTSPSTSGCSASPSDTITEWLGVPCSLNQTRNNTLYGQKCTPRHHTQMCFLLNISFQIYSPVLL